MLRTHASHAKAATRSPVAVALFAAAALFAGTMAATPALAGSDFSASDQFARLWTGQLSDRAPAGTYLAQVGTRMGVAGGAGAETPAAVGQSGPDYWGASLARDSR